MASAIKIKKIIEVKLNDTLEFVEEIVDVMPNNVYFISKAKGVLKFARTEEACNAYFAKKKEIADAKAAAKAEEAAKKAAEEEAARKAAEEVAPEEKVAPEEEVVPEEVALEEEVIPEEVAPEEKDGVAKMAEKCGLVELKPNADLRIFISGKGELFLALSNGFISLGALNNETPVAFLGEEPLTRKSPKNFSDILSKVGAMVPTESQYDEFAALLLSAAGSSTIEGFYKVCSFISFDNHLCTTANGKYKTYRGERDSLLETFAVYNLVCRMFIPFKE